VQFCCRTSPIPKTGVRVHTSTSFCHRNHFSFCATNMPNPILLVQNSCLGWFRAISLPHVTHYKNGCRAGCIRRKSFYHRNQFFVFRNEHAQSTTLGPKLMFGVVSRNFVAARHPFRKRVSGCIQTTSFRQRNHFFVFLNEHAQSTTLGPKLMFGVVLRNFVAARHDRARVPDLSVSGDNSDLVEVDPHDPTTMSEPEAPMQSLNQLPMVTDLVDARSA
jgi:hypothetical protein